MYHIGGVIRMNEEIKFHPNMLKVFSQKELLLMEKMSSYSRDKDGYINVMLVRTDKVFVEIFVDCEAENIGHALISNLLCDDLPTRLSKEEFWEIYSNSQAREVADCVLEIDE